MKPLYPLLLCNLLVLFSACKKDPYTSPEPKNTQTEVKNAIEQAYPKIDGQWVTTNWYGKQIKVQKKNGQYVWLGDIVFDEKTFDSLSRVSENPITRTFNPQVQHQWPAGIIYFTIDANFTPFERGLINDAIDHWRNNSSLRFVARTSEANYISIVRGAPSSGLFSNYVGMKGGQQVINLESGVFGTGNIIHEIGHAIGFYHEQSRTDRDNAIIIHWNNILPGREPQFETYTQLNLPGSQIGNFDFNSVMLYGWDFFSRNGQPTITRLDGSTFMAQRIGLSVGDIQTSNFIYGPPFAKVNLHITNSIEESGSVSEWSRREGFYSIDFYADQACTIPMALPEDRTVTYDFSSGSSIRYVSLQAGQSSYIIANYFYEHRSEYGNTVSFYESPSVGNGVEAFYR